MGRTLVVLLLSILLSSCTGNGYSTFYTDLTGGVPIEDASFVAYEGVPKLYMTNDFDRDGNVLGRRGYIAIGYSSFNGAAQNTKNAVTQAKKAGAEIVLVYSKYTNTVSGSLPFTTPTSSTTTTTGRGSVYGSFGTTPYTGTYTGTATSTTSGTQTTYIPYSVRRYDQQAVFYAKLKTVILGVMYGEMPADLRRALGTNKGVFVRLVITDTPAFFADILDGDIITAVDDRPVYSADQLNKLLRERAGQKVIVQISRAGLVKELSVQLGESG